MRIHSVFLAAIAALSLAACTHTSETSSNVPVSTTLASADVVSTSSGTYAVAKPIPSGATISPSNPCAESFDDVISYLEYLMKQKQGQQVASATQSNVSKRIEY